MRRSQSGFTIVELMIAVAIIGVVATFALPSFTSMVRDNRISTQSSDLIVDIAFARSEAARLGVKVTLCISADLAICAGSGTDWRVGRIIFSDVDGDGVVDAGDTILRKREPLSGDSSLIATGFGNTYRIQYRPIGILSHATGTFDLCDSRTGETGRRIAISGTGRASTTSLICS